MPLLLPNLSSMRLRLISARRALALAERCLKPDARNCLPSAATTGTRMDSVKGQCMSCRLAPHRRQKFNSNSRRAPSSAFSARSPHEEPETLQAWRGGGGILT